MYLVSLILLFALLFGAVSLETGKITDIHRGSLVLFHLQQNTMCEIVMDCSKITIHDSYIFEFNCSSNSIMYVCDKDIGLGILPQNINMDVHTRAFGILTLTFSAKIPSFCQVLGRQFLPLLSSKHESKIIIFNGNSARCVPIELICFGKHVYEFQKIPFVVSFSSDHGKIAPEYSPRPSDLITVSSGDNRWLVASKKCDIVYDVFIDEALQIANASPLLYWDIEASNGLPSNDGINEAEVVTSLLELNLTEPLNSGTLSLVSNITEPHINDILPPVINATEQSVNITLLTVNITASNISEPVLNTTESVDNNKTLINDVSLVNSTVNVMNSSVDNANDTLSNVTDSNVVVVNKTTVVNDTITVNNGSGDELVFTNGTIAAPIDNNSVYNETTLNHTLIETNNTLIETNNTVVDTNNTLIETNNTLVDTNNTLIETNNTFIDTNNTVVDQPLVTTNDTIITNDTSVSIDNGTKPIQNTTDTDTDEINVVGEGETEASCSALCNKDRGYCMNGHCICTFPFFGETCELSYVPVFLGCPPCVHGYCDSISKKCICNANYSGSICNEPTIYECNLDCQYGRCKIRMNRKICDCFNGFIKSSLAEWAPCDTVEVPISCHVDADCNGGKCTDTNICLCQAGRSGEHCQLKTCINDCSSHGKCMDGKCECHPGYIGADCSVPVTRACPGGCSPYGQCISSMCACNRGFKGDSCWTLDRNLAAKISFDISFNVPVLESAATEDSIIEIDGGQFDHLGLVIECQRYAGDADYLKLVSVAPSATSYAVHESFRLLAINGASGADDAYFIIKPQVMIEKISGIFISNVAGIIRIVYYDANNNAIQSSLLSPVSARSITDVAVNIWRLDEFTPSGTASIHVMSDIPSPVFIEKIALTMWPNSAVGDTNSGTEDDGEETSGDCSDHNFCTSHGLCMNGVCLCDINWGAPDCSQPLSHGGGEYKPPTTPFSGGSFFMHRPNLLWRAIALLAFYLVIHY
ncbi:hypothetical protein PCE1_001022 [Barthelona sp. PCE]